MLKIKFLNYIVMSTIVIAVIISSFVSIVIGFLLCLAYKKVNVIEVSDVLNTSVKRSDKQVLQDGLMQLKNEIAATGAVKQEKLADGNIRVSLKVVL